MRILYFFIILENIKIKTDYEKDSWIGFGHE